MKKGITRERMSLWTKFYCGSIKDHAHYFEYDSVPAVGDTIDSLGPYGIEQHHRVIRIETEMVFSSGKVIKLKRPIIVLERVYG